MNRKILIFLIIVVLLIISGGVYLLTSDSAKDSKIQMMESNNQTAVPQTTTAQPSVTKGKYVDYTTEVIADTSGTKLLFFHAPWCPQCRDLDIDIKKGTIPDGTTIIKVDYDTHQSLRQKYGVTIQTTIVKVDDAGGLIKKFVAYDDPTLQSVLENL